MLLTLLLALFVGLHRPARFAQTAASPANSFEGDALRFAEALFPGKQFETRSYTGQARQDRYEVAFAEAKDHTTLSILWDASGGIHNVAVSNPEAVLIAGRSRPLANIDSGRAVRSAARWLILAGVQDSASWRLKSVAMSPKEFGYTVIFRLQGGREARIIVDCHDGALKSLALVSGLYLRR